MYDAQNKIQFRGECKLRTLYDYKYVIADTSFDSETIEIIKSDFPIDFKIGEDLILGEEEYVVADIGDKKFVLYSNNETLMEAIEDGSLEEDEVTDEDFDSWYELEIVIFVQDAL